MTNLIQLLSEDSQMIQKQENCHREAPENESFEN